MWYTQSTTEARARGIYRMTALEAEHERLQMLNTNEQMKLRRQRKTYAFVWGCLGCV